MKKILVIDDEEIIRSLASEMINMFGYQCLLAEDGNAGLEIIEKENPDLVLCDFYMPNMSGEEVIAEIAVKFPKMKVILTTGKELDDDEAERINAHGIIGVLNKPFSLMDLKNRLTEILD